MKALVTGGTGFTGSHLTRRLLEKGQRVTVLDTQTGLFEQELRDLGAEIVLGSVTDRALVNRLSKGQDVIYHLAAAFRKINVPKQVYWDANVEGTRYVLESAAEHDVPKVVYCSTQGVHGHVEDPPGDESTPIEPEDYYQYTKWEGERVCQTFMEEGLNVTTIRPTAIYGPGDPGRFLILYKMARSGRFLMFGDGQTYYHPVYITNLVDAFELAATVPEARGQTYIAADEHYYTLDDLVTAVGRSMDQPVKIIHLPFRPIWVAALLTEAICKPLRVSPPLFRRRVDWYRQVRAFSIDKARTELGYEPAVGLDEGLKRTAEWYTKNGYL